MWQPADYTGLNGPEEEEYELLVDTVAVLTPEKPTFARLKLNEIAFFLARRDSFSVVTMMDSLLNVLPDSSNPDSAALQERCIRDIELYLDSNAVHFRSLQIDVERFKSRISQLR